MNLPDIDWNDLIIEGNQYAHDINNAALEIFNNLELEQLVKTATGNDTSGTNNILDLVLTTHPTFVVGLEVKEGISDHDAIHLKIIHKTKRKHATKKTVKMWSKASNETIEDLKNDVLNEYSSLLDRLPHLDIKTAWTEFENILVTNESKYIPAKHVDPNRNKPWINKTAKKAIRKSKRAYRIAKTYATWKNYRDKRIAARREIEKSHRLYVDTVVLELYKNTEKWRWNSHNSEIQWYHHH